MPIVSAIAMKNYCIILKICLQLALLEDSSHVFYSCGEDAVVFEIDLRQEKPNKYVMLITVYLGVTL